MEIIVKAVTYVNDLNLKATELRLRLPGTDPNQEKYESSASALTKSSNKRSSPEMDNSSEKGDQNSAPAPK